MADISNVDTTTIKDLYERLESLSCAFSRLLCSLHSCTDYSSSSNYDPDTLLMLRAVHPLKVYTCCVHRLSAFLKYPVFYMNMPRDWS